MSILTRADKGEALTHAEMDDNLSYLVPPGAVMAFARNTAPDGWLECAGQAVSRTTYADLYAALGTTFGNGNGSTTFNLPNLRGEFIRGWDNGRGVDQSRTFGSSQTDAFQGHRHPQRAGSETGQPGSYGRYGDGDGNVDTGLTTGTPSTDGTNGTPRTASETRPRNIALMYCIKI